jgi:hypothetical protein
MRRQRSKIHPAADLRRQDAGAKPRRKDPYALDGKLSDPSACSFCGAIYRNGRWAWGSAPVDAKRVTCPACRRAKDRYPAGIVRIGGDYAAQHKDELLNLARNVEQREKAEHPMKRILAVRDDDTEVEITTSDPRLARGIGEALAHAHKGKLDYTFTERENVMRVRWER